MDFTSASLVTLAAGVRERQVSAVELVEHTLARIEASNPTVNAFVAVDGESALGDAALIDRRIAAGDPVGPLAGIPIGVKDLEDAAGFVTTIGSALRVDDPPARQDSTLVARLRAAGCVVIGKTNTPEHGWTSDTVSPAFGATRNPVDTTRSAGGSSGGSAAAIAAGMVPLATGSDGGGSIRIPSSLCGLSGFMPTHGRVPAGSPHAAPGSGLLSVKGPMARRIRDIAYALDAVMGPDGIDLYALPAPAEAWYPQVAGYVAPPSRVVWSTMGFDVDAEVLASCHAALAELRNLGTEVIEVDQVLSEDPVWTFLTMWSVYAWRSYVDVIDTDRWEQVDPGLRDQIQFGREAVAAPAFASAFDACFRYGAEIEACLDEHAATVLLTPTVAGQAGAPGEHGTIDGLPRLDWVRFTYPCNLTRRPAGTVPVGATAAGLPVGLQVVGRHLGDLDVLRTLVTLEDMVG